MNTGNRNTLGRPILRGPRGGLYVMNGTKRLGKGKFKVAPAATALNLAKAHMNTLTTIVARKAYTRSRSVNMNNAAWAELNRYRINLNARARAARAAKKTAAPAALGPTAALRAAIAHVNKLKTHGGRVRYAERVRGTLSAANHNALVRHVGARGAVAAPAAAARAPVPNSGNTTTERNARLAAIRARLNALRAARREAMPKRRNNVHKRLRNAVARVRTRLETTRSTTAGSRNAVQKTVSVPFCHALASVPRKECRMRTAKVSTYSSPLINDGTVVATRESDIDIDWFSRQDAYVKNLSDYDFWTAQAHTNRSHSWIGPYLYSREALPTYFPGRYGGLDDQIAPLWPQVRKMILDGTFQRRSGSEAFHDAWIDDFRRSTNEKYRYDLFCDYTNRLPAQVMHTALKMYRDDLMRIIAAAPKSRKKMVLYRGASFDIFKNQPGHWHTLKSFCSAAYNFEHALGYGNTLQRITVLPGTPVLLVAGMNQWNKNGEFEIMVNMRTKYLIRSRNVRRAGWTGQRHILRVTDVTITK